MADAYRADTDALGLGRPDVEPLATTSIAEIIDLIERLIANGAAYASGDGDVYFSVAAYPGYGELSGQRPDDLIAGSRVEPGEGKRSPLDFALWKATSRRRTPPGTRPGGAAARAGTSSALRWRTPSWARTSTCTAAAST